MNLSGPFRIRRRIYFIATAVRDFLFAREAIALLLLRSARERRDGVSLAVGRKAPPGQLERKKKKRVGGTLR